MNSDHSHSVKRRRSDNTIRFNVGENPSESDESPSVTQEAVDLNKAEKRKKHILLAIDIMKEFIENSRTDFSNRVICGKEVKIKDYDNSMLQDYLSKFGLGMTGNFTNYCPVSVNLSGLTIQQAKRKKESSFVTEEAVELNKAEKRKKHMLLAVDIMKDFIEKSRTEFAKYGIDKSMLNEYLAKFGLKMTGNFKDHHSFTVDLLNGE